MTTPKAADPVDLTNCDREPIHIPGRIQPHGILVALAEPDLRIVQISDNTGPQIGRAPQSLLDQPLDALLSAEYVAYLRATLEHEDIEQNPLYVWTAQIQGSAQPFDGLIHRYNGMLLLELEPARPPETPGLDFYRLVKSAIGRIQRTTDFQDFCDATAQEVRALNGFDRVMIYRFDADGHGEVIAEAAAEGLESFLGLHYPASDIPRQARALYLRNWLRLIPDIGYTPADIIPTLTPGTAAPLDLSYAVLRSVSPIHVEYLSNMGVSASMSISLVKDGRLWGLIACHHYSPKYIPFELRAASEFLGQAASLQLTAKENAEYHEYEVRLKDAGSQLVQQMAQAETWSDGLMSGAVRMLDLIDSNGAALRVDERIQTLGATPSEQDLQTLIGWLAAKAGDVFATASLASECPELAHCKDVASGVLAAPISPELGEYLLWFRPEALQTVNWAGDPAKLATVGEDGGRLSPRKSFDLWQQHVALHALPWKEVEIEAATRLRNTIRGVVLRRAADLARLNAALARSNTELDAFAYIASHDLKEPLRGMHNYAHFLLEDYHDQLDDDGKAKLETLVRLTERMDALLDSLLQYSRVGRVELLLKRADLNSVLHDVLDMLSVRLEGVEVRIPRPLPTIRCDPLRVGEVLQNLISNAAKYNTRPDKWIEIGYQSPDEQPPAYTRRERQYIFYVRDNGIGIRAKHFDTIFRIFKRLHAADRFGGGTGVGLTIAKKIVERHGGEIWLESTPDIGTTFFFSVLEHIDE